MVLVSRARLFAIVIAATLVLDAGGYAWETARFGWNRADAEAHLQREITGRIAERIRLVTATAVRVARSGDLVSAAAGSRDRLPDLFARLSDPIAAGPDSVSATVWIPTGLGPEYRALAWTDGPAEDIAPTFLNRAPDVFIATGASGLRLVFVQPIDHGASRVGIAAAETPLSVAAPAGTFGQQHLIASSAGPLEAVALDGRVPAAVAGRFTVTSPEGRPLLEVRAPAEQLDGARRTFRWRVAAVSLLPWLAALLAWLNGLVGRRRASRTLTTWAMWTAAIMVVTIAGALAAIWLLRKTETAVAWRDALAAVGLLALAAIAAGDAWRRAIPFRARRRRPARFVLEHLAGGLVLGAGYLLTAWLWRNRIGPGSIDQWHLPVLPSSVPTAVALASLLVAQIALAWAAAGVIGVLAARWRLSWRSAAAWAAAGLWLAPVAASSLWPATADARPVTGALVIALSALVFGLAANSLRRHYRRGSEARRLVLQFCALLAPILAAYPLAASSADRTMGDIIERDYAPATQDAQQPGRLMSSLTAAWADIDAVTELPDLLREAGTSVSSTQLAFRVWNRTILSRQRITSQIELYGPTHALVSRFALNVPEFGSLSQSGERTWPGTGCEWDAFAEVARFGAGERRMLHAERALCGAGGEFLGAVVVRIIPDYRTLPFVTSANPYYDALGTGERQVAGSRVSELQVVVYGWSLQPVFVSGRTIWPLDQELADRVYHSRQPFWADRPFEGRTYHIYMLNDRGGIYALGYPASTPLQHATRLAESAALLLLLFIVYLAATVIRLPIRGRPAAPLGRLFAEIRASFYRKLFLFFVLAAIAPVVLFAIAFGTYMTDKLQADVEAEASSVVIMARRVLDELSAAQAPSGQSRPAPTDDVMVWIRQVVDQDVNLFEGSELRATSQRDLFDSGLLPTRTPASVYRLIALDRRPVAVVDDRIGTFRYKIAAAPVPALGRETMLTVPLASRQREIDRQIDELTQGVLTGAVVLVLFAAALGASVAGRVSDPVARLTRATRLVAAGRFDEKLVADTADELGRLVGDFNTMTQMLVAQRAELARTNQLKAWAEMSRQVAHEIKNPLTPIQLAAEHLQRVHEDAKRPLGPIVDQCLSTILKQVRLLRRIASEFSTFAGEPTPRFEAINVAALIDRVVEPYRTSLPEATRIVTAAPGDLPPIRGDRTLLARALTNLIENAIQAMPTGGLLAVSAALVGDAVEIEVADTGVGMDDEGVRRAFEPYFSTKTAGSGLGLANARRNVEICGGRVAMTSRLGEGTTVTVTVPIDRPAGTERA